MYLYITKQNDMTRITSIMVTGIEQDITVLVEAQATNFPYKETFIEFIPVKAVSFHDATRKALQVFRETKPFYSTCGFIRSFYTN